MSDPAPVVAGLRCHKCGRAAEVRQDQMTEYERHGWPTCCGEVMGITHVAGSVAGGLNCPGCGGFVVPPARVCPRCGSHLPPEANRPPGGIP